MITFIELKRLRYIQEEMERLRLDLGLPKSPTISDMPKAPFSCSNKLEDNMIKIDNLYHEYQDLKEKFIESLNEIHNLDHRKILYLNYIDRLDKRKISMLTKKSDRTINRAIRKYEAIIKANSQGWE